MEANGHATKEDDVVENEDIETVFKYGVVKDDCE
jgi:hypothetical protein